MEIGTSSECTADVLMQIEMGLLDPYDMEAILEAVATSIEGHTDLERPEFYNGFSLMCGIICGNIIMEQMHNNIEGNYSLLMQEQINKGD